METIVNKNSDIYYSTQYWNDFPKVLEYMSENFTGDKRKWWVQDFRERFAQESFEHGLFLNCGNGWVERDFIDCGIVNNATAFDYSMDLLKDAEEKKENRRINYYQADVNQVFFSDDCFDLIVNVAAMHHVQYINRVCLQLAKALKPNGLFVNYDYIGPQRNQYAVLNWLLINLVNLSLPETIRKPNLKFPHLPTMLHTDPTEAIHSNLILSTITRYFDIFERHDTGGGIAYEILTNNPKLQNNPVDSLNQHIDRILEYDKRLSAIRIIQPFFSYFLAKPQKERLEKRKVIKRYQRIENKRELRAMKRRGIYSLRNYLFLACWRVINKIR